MDNQLQKHNQRYSFSIKPYMTILKNIFRGSNKTIRDKELEPEPNLIQQADALYLEGQYMEVYQLLHQLRFCSNVEVLWRMARALYALSDQRSLRWSHRPEMIEEAYQLIRTALMKPTDNADVHKWMAILLDKRAGYAGTYTRSKTLLEVKEHLLRATELNPLDVTTLYMLGHWCYELANLSWFQRKIATILFTSPPSASFEEAYRYFAKAEELKPRFFIGNTFMLGKVSYLTGRCYKAKYYLDIAASMPCRTEHERELHKEAKQLSRELNRYDLSKFVVLYETE